jgi:two-component system nitrate/nitrite response regulator NarL
MGAEDVPREAVNAAIAEFPVRVVILSDVRFLREGLGEVFGRDTLLSISGLFADLQEALPGIVDSQPDVVVVDAALPDGSAAVRRIRHAAPQVCVVLIGVGETAENIIAWAEAGAAGYIPRTAGLAEIAALLIDITRGKQTCLESVAAGLLRRLSNVGTTNGGDKNPPSLPALTAREEQIAGLIATGMSNKDIARHLKLGVATVKTHVHHLLGKLSLQRRGQAAISLHEPRDRY